MNKTGVRVRTVYYKRYNKVKIYANSTEFYPKYLYYQFEYLHIPKNATIVFKDKTIQGGIEEWLKQTQNKIN